MVNGALCICHQPEVSMDIFSGPAEHSDAVAAVPPPRPSHLLTEEGFSLMAKGFTAPTGQMLHPTIPESPLATDTFLELVPQLLPTRSPLLVTLAAVGLPQGALKPSHQQDAPDGPRK